MMVTVLEKREIYKDNFTEYLLCLALDVGEGMLRCGAEISRVEDTIERICHAYGAVHVEVFTVISFINAAVRMPDGSYSSQLRRIRSTVTNLGLLEKYNALSRKICAQKPELDEIDAEIRRLKRFRFYSAPTICMASGFIAGGFTLFFGGSWNDSFVSFFIGVLIGIIDFKMPSRVNAIAKTVISAALSTLIAIVLAKVGIASSSDYVIMGAIMILVGTAMRDLLYGDLLAGTLKILQALLIALMIAFGYMISVELLGIFGVSLDVSGTVDPGFDKFFKLSFLLSSIGALISSLAFAILFSVAPRHLFWGSIAGLFTYIVYYAVEFFTVGALFPAAFLSTMVTALIAEIASRVRKAPTIIFLIPGVIPTVPGGLLYRAMRSFLLHDFEAGLAYTMQTLQIGLGIAGGIFTISIIFGIVVEKIKKRKIRCK